MQSMTHRAQDQSTRWDSAGRQKIATSQTGTTGKAMTQAKTQIGNLRNSMTQRRSLKKGVVESRGEV